MADRRQKWEQIKEEWERINRQTAANPAPTQSAAAASHAEPNSAAYGEVLRKGEDFWRVLYLPNEEERTAFLREKLPQHIQDSLHDSTDSNSLWKALDTIKQAEQKLLKEKEAALQQQEQVLQRQLKSAEAEVDQQLAQRSLTTLWKPIVHAIAKLRFSDTEIEQFANTNETTQLLRQTLTSWQGLLTLFLMTLVTVVALDEQSRNALIIALANWLEQPWLTNLFNQPLLAEVKNFFISLNKTIVTWLSNPLQWIQTTGSSGLKVLAAITATVTALIPVLKVLGNYITSVQKEQARIQGERDVLLKAAQSKADDQVKTVALLKAQVEEQRQRAGLTANYVTLMDFVSDRLQLDDYGKRLGLMQQVKQDLADLSDRLTDYQHNREELQKCFPRGPARVILYIDDLDRCPPNRVVEVLEAVQLLLNTRLFIVILGIDDRYIARALEQVYRGVLKRGGKPSGIDYLEKIIQIPYRMRPISPAAVDSYLRAQLQLRRPDPPADTQTVQAKSPDPEAALQQSEVIPPEEISNLPEEIPEPTETPQLLAETNTPPPSLPTAPATDSKTYLETTARVTELDETEFQLLVDCCKWVDITPRTAKRLINIYKILQIIWSTRSQSSPPQPLPSAQDKRVVMSFLALSGRYPSYMRNLFEEIDVKLEEQMQNASDITTTDNPELKIELDTLLKDSNPLSATADAYAQREWRKFKADIKQMLRDPQNSPDQTIQLTLDQSTFDLMLSFCFVGDIGYDPDDYHLETRPSKNQDSTGSQTLPTEPPSCTGLPDVGVVEPVLPVE